jgi:glutamine amidotransferase
VTLTREPALLYEAERIVVPGVGAFPAVRQKLLDSGTLPALEAARARGCPILGICVGMQLLGDHGNEFARVPGLGWVRGEVRLLVPGPERKLPHIGWAPLTAQSGPLFAGLPDPAYAYFVHSYVLECRDHADVVARADYGEPFAAAVQRGNGFGTQFHPEKSGATGLQILSNFCERVAP